MLLLEVPIKQERKGVRVEMVRVERAEDVGTSQLEFSVFPGSGETV